MTKQPKHGFILTKHKDGKGFHIGREMKFSAQIVTVCGKSFVYTKDEAYDVMVWLERARLPTEPSALEIARDLFPALAARLERVDEDWCRQAILEAGGRGENEKT